MEIQKACLGGMQTGKDGVVSIASNKLKLGAIYMRPFFKEDRGMICIEIGDVKWTRNVSTITVTAIKDVEACLVQCSCPRFLAKNAYNCKDIIMVSLNLCMRMQSMLVRNASSSFSTANCNSWELMPIRANKTNEMTDSFICKRNFVGIVSSACYCDVGLPFKAHTKCSETPNVM